MTETVYNCHDILITKISFFQYSHIRSCLPVATQDPPV